MAALMGENNKRSETARLAHVRLAARLQASGRSAEQIARAATYTPNKFENTILEDVVFPADIKSTFGEVGGLDSMKRDIYESLILPLQNPALFKQMHSASSLLSIPTGVLLYGPPGTGPTTTRCAQSKCVGAMEEPINCWV